MPYDISKTRDRLRQASSYDLSIYEPTSQGDRELKEFDWFNFESTAKPFTPKFVSIMSIKGTETPYDRKMRMVRELSQACIACSMCELGLKPAEKGNESRDPHVFSNLNPKRFMVVGQNPGWNEVVKRVPFVGAAGKNFDEEVQKNGLSREDFYVCNTVRCFTQNNAKPTLMHKKRCEPFLQMEINLIKPLLVVTLGEVAFSQFCPDAKYSDSLKKLTKSDRYDVHVFAIYHPSPLNFADGSRREAFNDQIATMCKLIKALKKKHGEL